MESKRPRIPRQSKVNQVNVVEVKPPYKMDTLAKITVINRSRSRCETIARLAMNIIERRFKETKKTKLKLVKI